MKYAKISSTPIIITVGKYEFKQMARKSELDKEDRKTSFIIGIFRGISDVLGLPGIKIVDVLDNEEDSSSIL